jgi:uncharacterized membrane protein YphA (DoxX/SURF4 family)
MVHLTALYRQTDVEVTEWMARRAVTLLRCSLGVVFFWFGVLKFVPDLSPAADLAARTLTTLSLGLVAPGLLLPGLAAWECLIGLGLLSGRCLRLTILLLLLQMVGTLTPLLLFPTLTFTHVPFAPTLEGQYILKNLVLISAALVIGALVRGGRVIADPAVVREVGAHRPAPLGGDAGSAPASASAAVRPPHAPVAA